MLYHTLLASVALKEPNVTQLSCGKYHLSPTEHPRESSVALGNSTICEGHSRVIHVRCAKEITLAPEGQVEVQAPGAGAGDRGSAFCSDSNALEAFAAGPPVLSVTRRGWGLSSLWKLELSTESNSAMWGFRAH